MENTPTSSSRSFMSSPIDEDRHARTLSRLQPYAKPPIPVQRQVSSEKLCSVCGTSFGVLTRCNKCALCGLGVCKQCYFGKWCAFCTAVNGSPEVYQISQDLLSNSNVEDFTIASSAKINYDAVSITISNAQSIMRTAAKHLLSQVKCCGTCGTMRGSNAVDSSFCQYCGKVFAHQHQPCALVIPTSSSTDFVYFCKSCVLRRISDLNMQENYARVKLITDELTAIGKIESKKHEKEMQLLQKEQESRIRFVWAEFATSAVTALVFLTLIVLVFGKEYFKESVIVFVALLSCLIKQRAFK